MDNKRSTLSPSSCNHFETSCSRHLQLKLVHGLERPKSPFPGVLSTVATAMENFLFPKEGRPTASLDLPGVPDGVLYPWRKMISSEPIVFDDLGVEFVLRGRIDGYIQHPDGSVSIVDAKFTTEKKVTGGGAVQTYAYQLAAYAHIFEHAATPVPGTVVDKVGLLCATPTGSFGSTGPTAGLLGALHYVPIPLNRGAFLDFLRGIAEVAAADEPFPPDPACATCKYELELAAASLPTV